MDYIKFIWLWNNDNYNLHERMRNDLTLTKILPDKYSILYNGIIRPSNYYIGIANILTLIIMKTNLNSKIFVDNYSHVTINLCTSKIKLQIILNNYSNLFLKLLSNENIKLKIIVGPYSKLSLTCVNILNSFNNMLYIISLYKAKIVNYSSFIAGQANSCQFSIIKNYAYIKIVYNVMILNNKYNNPMIMQPSFSIYKKKVICSHSVTVNNYLDIININNRFINLIDFIALNVYNKCIVQSN